MALIEKGEKVIAGKRARSRFDELQDILKEKRKDLTEWGKERERAIEKNNIEHKRLCERKIKENQEYIKEIEEEIKALS